MFALNVGMQGGRFSNCKSMEQVRKKPYIMNTVYFKVEVSFVSSLLQTLPEIWKSFIPSM